MRRPVLLAAVTLALGFLAGCAAADEPAAPPAAASSSVPQSEASTELTAKAHRPSVNAAAGSYISLADYQSDPRQFDESDVVLFFHAPWCPTCQAAEQSLTSEPVPAGLTIVKVDFDSELELRRKYGVTVQHTFVQVTPDGRELATWSGSRSATEIQAQTV